MRDGSDGSALSEFERIYRGNVGVLTAFFARRCSESTDGRRISRPRRSFEPRRGLPALILVAAPHAPGCAGSPATSMPSTALRGRASGMRWQGLLGSSIFPQRRSTS